MIIRASSCERTTTRRALPSFPTRRSSDLICPNRHSFDIARQGYVNLLPVQQKRSRHPGDSKAMVVARSRFLNSGIYQPRSEEHTSELQSRPHLVCRLLLEKKKSDSSAFAA